MLNPKRSNTDQKKGERVLSLFFCVLFNHLSLYDLILTILTFYVKQTYRFAIIK